MPDPPGGTQTESSGPSRRDSTGRAEACEEVRDLPPLLKRLSRSRSEVGQRVSGLSGLGDGQQQVSDQPYFAHQLCSSSMVAGSPKASLSISLDSLLQITFGWSL